MEEEEEEGLINAMNRGHALGDLERCTCSLSGALKGFPSAHHRFVISCRKVLWKPIPTCTRTLSFPLNTHTFVSCQHGHSRFPLPSRGPGSNHIANLQNCKTTARVVTWALAHELGTYIKTKGVSSVNPCSSSRIATQLRLWTSNASSSSFE